jgi:hypothetical protein
MMGAVPQVAWHYASDLNDQAPSAKRRQGRHWRQWVCGHRTRLAVRAVRASFGVAYLYNAADGQLR